jgi:hypothetical protein
MGRFTPSLGEMTKETIRPPSPLPPPLPPRRPPPQPTLKFGSSMEGVPELPSRSLTEPATPWSRSQTVKMTAEQIAALPLSTPRSTPLPPPTQPSPSTPPVAASVSPEATPEALKTPRRLGRLVGWSIAGGLLVGLAVLGGLHAALPPPATWVAPTLLSSSDPRVEQVAASLQQEMAHRSELAFQKTELEARLREAERWIDLEEGFQKSFQASVRSDIEQQQATLKHLQSLLAWRNNTNASEFPTHFGADLDEKVAAVEQRIRMLEAAGHGGQGSRYEVLAVRREYDRSVVAADQARELAAGITKTLGETDEALRQKDALLASIRSSPYAFAITGDVALGFVPYENKAKTGDLLVSCTTANLLCTEVGSVGEVLSGEVRGTNPFGGKEERGRLFRLKLTDPKSAERSVLLVRPPKGAS